MSARKAQHYVAWESRVYVVGKFVDVCNKKVNDLVACHLFEIVHCVFL